MQLCLGSKFNTKHLVQRVNCLYLETDRRSLERELGRDRHREENLSGRWPLQGYNLCSEPACLDDKNILLLPAGVRSRALLLTQSKICVREEGQKSGLSVMPLVHTFTQLISIAVLVTENPWVSSLPSNHCWSYPTNCITLGIFHETRVSFSDCPSSTSKVRGGVLAQLVEVRC